MPPSGPISCCGSRSRSSRGSSPSACSRSTRRWSGRSSSVLARMERRGISIDRNVLSRLSGEFAQEAAALESEINKDAGETVNPGSPKQLGDILFGKLGLPGGTKTKTGQWATGARAARRSRRAGPQAAADDPRLAAGVEAEIDLHGRAARLRQSDDAPRPHQLRARLHHDRAAVVVRPQSAEHPGPHRGRPQDPPRLHRRAGDEARVGRLFADRASAAGRDRRHRAAAEGLPRGARHSRHDRVGNVRRADQGHAGARSAAAPRRSTSASSTASRPSGSPTSSASPATRPAPTSKSISSVSPASATSSRSPRPTPRSMASCTRCSAANAITRRSGPRTRRSAPSTSAPPSMRACRAPRPTSSAAP